MLASFLESIKYVGHMYPVAFVRIVLGYQSLAMVVSRVNTGYLENAYISDRLNLSSGGEASGLYFDLFKSLIQGQWLMMTYVLIIFEVIIGCSYVVGFGVRVASLLGMLLSCCICIFFLVFNPVQGKFICSIFICCFFFWELGVV